MKKNIFEDGEELSKAYKNAEYLQVIDPKQYIAERNKLLISLLEGMSGLNISTLQNARVFAIACTVENIYHMRHFNWVLPCSFVSNLIQSVTSGSKLVTVVNGKMQPAGSYTTYLEWLNREGAEHLTCPKGDIDTFIDNIGRYIVKSYRVSVEKNKQADIITSCLHIVGNPEGRLQTLSRLKPSSWDKNMDEQEIQEKMEDKVTIDKSNFRKIRYDFIAYMINEYSVPNVEVENRIEKLLSRQKRHCTNEECGEQYSNLKRKCDKCGSTVRKVVEERIEKQQTSSYQEKYLNLGEIRVVNTKELKLGEPILLNPNSYSNIEHILDELKVNLGITTVRQWSFVGADGPPYCLASRIVESNREKYDWVSMVPGTG